jgi:hypothetical protein
MIVRRGTNYPNGSAIPRLDFMGSESFAPVQVNPTVNNLGSDAVRASVALTTEFGSSATFYTSQISTTPFIGARYFALPSDRIKSGDFHQVMLLATPTPQNPTSSRFLIEMLRAPAAQSLTLGPAMNSATVTSLGAAAPRRLRVQVAAQSDYNAAVAAGYEQADRSVNLFVTTAYVGETPTTWTLDIPDLTSAGYDPTWGLTNGNGVDWTVDVFGGSILPFFGAPAVDGALAVGAEVSGSIP